MSSLPKLKNRLGLIALFVLDFAALFIIFQAAIFTRRDLFPLIFRNLPRYDYNPGSYWWMFAVWLFIMLYEEGYSRRFTFWDEIKFLWQSSFMASAAILTILFIAKRGQEYSRILVGAMLALSIILFPVMRLWAKKALYGAGLLLRKVIIAGSGEAAMNAYRAIMNEPNLGYKIAGFVDNAGSGKLPPGFRAHKGLEKIERYIKSAGAQDVIVAKPELSKEELTSLVNHIQHKAENTLYIPDIGGIAVAGTELRHFFREQTLIIEIKNNLANPFIYASKRVLDYGAAALIFLALLPVMLCIAALIRLGSVGPAMYRQLRVGKNGRLFHCYKFRTMYSDSAPKLQELLRRDPQARREWEATYKLSSDPRVTPVGRFLRGTSLDELPQLLNILRGEMSLVGPRPVVTEELEKYYGEDAVFYLRVPPGLTGLWQVSGRSDTTYKYRISLDSWYVKNWGLWLDTVILFKTVGVVLNREGAR